MTDFPEIPIGTFESRRAALLLTTDSLSAQALRYAQEEYSDYSTLERCALFTSYDLEDAPLSYIETLQRVGFFPWVEARQEFDEVLYQAILSRYKSSYDHIRRALELVLVGAFFSSEASKAEDAWQWVRSDRDTPPFTRALKSILQVPPFGALDRAVGWAGRLREFYWELSDVVHVRGMEASFLRLQPASLHTMGTRVPRFDRVCLSRVLDSFILCTRHCATVLAATNPILLIGLPVDEKFGLNPPVSGYFNDVQAERIFQLILPEARDFFLDWIAKNSAVQSVVGWFRNRPDLTDEDLRKQSEELRREMERFSK